MSASNPCGRTDLSTKSPADDNGHDLTAGHVATLQYALDLWSMERWTRDTRYYEIHTHQNLWGEWVVTRVNGGAGEALGRVVHETTCDRRAALAIAKRLAARRRQRNYRREAVPGPVPTLEEFTRKGC